MARDERPQRPQARSRQVPINKALIRARLGAAAAEGSRGQGEMRAPSVLALATDAFGGRGGIAQYNRDFLSALARAGAQVVVLPRHAPDVFDTPDGIAQRAAVYGRLAYSCAAVRTALAQCFDLVFCGHLYMAPLGVLVSRLSRAKLIVQMHGEEVWTRPSALQRLAVRSGDMVLCVSRHTRACVIEQFAIPPERVRVVPNTVREIFQPGDGELQRKTWGLVGKRILLTVGRIDSCHQYKGHDRVIAALPYLVAQGHDVVYVVIGEGDDIGRLRKIAADTGVQERVRFIGAIASESLVDAYRAADLFVMPSTGEGFGIVYLEAMASGTPALGLAAGGAVDALGNGELGIIARENDLAATIDRELSRSKKPGGDLARATRARFGRESFNERVGAIVSELARDE